MPVNDPKDNTYANGFFKKMKPGTAFGGYMNIEPLKKGGVKQIFPRVDDLIR